MSGDDHFSDGWDSMYRGKIITKTFLFVLLVCIAISAVQKSFSRPEDEQAYNSVTGFYSLPKNSVDAIYIGSSSTFQFFQPPLAWKNQGIRVYSLSSDGLPSSALKYWLIEAHKKQPDAVILLNLNCFRDGTSPGNMLFYHSAVDNLPFSLNKLALIRDLYTRKPDADLTTFIELLMPLVRFHSSWNEIRMETLYREPDGYMGASTMWNLLNMVSPQKRAFEKDPDPKLTDTWQLEILDDLLETIDKLGARALFVVTPQTVDAGRAGVYRYLEEYVSERGYPCYNLQQKAAELGLDPKTDYYNNHHTNIHGSVKVTEAVSRYLLEHYGFEDQRGKPGTEAWDESGRRYAEEAGKYALDFELEAAPQLLELPAPRDLSFAYTGKNGGGSLISWMMTEYADGFAVFRKDPEGGWKRIGEAGGDETSYFDENRVPASSYAYTVVPFLEDGEIRRYGRWSIPGISTGYYYPAPMPDEIWADANGVTFTWNAAADEKDWNVFRKETGGEWVFMGETKEPWYTDGTVKFGTEYTYTVSAQTAAGKGFLDEEGLQICISNSEGES